MSEKSSERTLASIVKLTLDASCNPSDPIQYLNWEFLFTSYTYVTFDKYITKRCETDARCRKQASFPPTRTGHHVGINDFVKAAMRAYQTEVFPSGWVDSSDNAYGDLEEDTEGQEADDLDDGTEDEDNIQEDNEDIGEGEGADSEADSERDGGSDGEAGYEADDVDEERACSASEDGSEDDD